jgi:hypothetical protein
MPTSRLLARWSPWSRAEGLRWLVLAIVGHAAWLTAYVFALSESSFDHQIRWILLAVVGFLLVGFADVTWLLRGHLELIRRRSTILPVDSAPSKATESEAAQVVAGPDQALYHRAECLFVVGRDWPRLDRATAGAAGRKPCGVCRP